jgi:hypothetical protein
MSLQRKLKDILFVLWEMLLLGLYKVLFDILDLRWRREFKDIGMHREEVCWREVGIRRAFKILKRSQLPECRCMYTA